jgi:hypothetical protein
MVAEFLDTIQFLTPNLFSKVHDYTLGFFNTNVFPFFEVLGTTYHANDSKTNCIQDKQ